jgi:hypothetical protein
MHEVLHADLRFDNYRQVGKSDNANYVANLDTPATPEEFGQPED